MFLDLQQEEKNYIQQHALSLAAFALKDQQACPVCGSTHHPQPLAEMPPIERISGKLAKVMEQRELLFKQVLKEQAEYAGQQSSQKLWTEQMEMIQTMLEEALKSSLDSPYQQLKQKKTARNHLINEMDNLDRQYRALLQEKAVLTERLRQKEEGLKERQKEFGQWQEQYRKNKDLLHEHKNKDGQTDYIKALALLHMNMQRREKVEKELSEKLADRERLQKEQDGCQQQLFQFQSELDLIKEKGTEKKSRIAQLKETLTILTDGQPVLLWKKQTEQELAKLLQEEETIGKLWQSIQERYRQCSEERQEMSGKVETFGQVLEKQQAGLLDECQKAGFSSIEEMRQYHVEKEALHTIEEEILAFEQEGAAIQARMEQLTKAVTGENITEEALEALKKDLAEKETALEELSRKVVLLKNNHDNLQQNLEKLKDYQGKQSKIKEKKEMLDDLAKLTQGNAFVHYIANKQLLYVAQEATNRLKYMTHGRYAIEIENGEFYIQDDFNGGVTRSVRTLSGGEIFITSFALALALSDRIQMKNNVPIQTFFLDEGFGSLDPGMLDVVMDSLESLYDENLKVGVISHVEELKNRIPVRLEIQHHKESFEGAKAVL